MTGKHHTAPDDGSARDAILDAALPHVAFDGWSEAMFRRAVEDAGADPAEAKLAFPRGALDLAIEVHKRDDRRLAGAMSGSDFNALRIREKITKAVRMRLELAGEHKEAVRRAAALFALPLYAPDGARLTWGTADTIWRGIGDPSTDYNWYTKRMTLSGVYSATLLYWLGDTSVDQDATWRFLDRRIEDVMRFEKVKAQIRDNPLARLALAGPRAILSRIKAPSERPGDLPVGFPGRH